MKIRLDKYLADSGFGTRSEVKLLVKSGSISLNGNVVKDSGIKIDTENDEILVRGKRVGYSAYEYYMLHKPSGIITASRDKNEKTVIDLIKSKKRRDLFPVGRLDRDTEGLLLITNDGDLSHHLLSPSKHVSKTYLAFVTGEPSEDIYTHFKEGIDIGDDTLTKPAELRRFASVSDVLNIYNDKVLEDRFSEYNDAYIFEITITEGRYHEIKRMFEAEGCEVVYLKRYSMGSLILDFDLSPGEYRLLTDSELSNLKA